MRKLAKKQTGGDSTNYYLGQEAMYRNNIGSTSSNTDAKGVLNVKKQKQAFAKADAAKANAERQSKKGKPGYTSMGFPIKKQMGGSAKPTPSKPIDFKEAKAKAKYNPNIIEEKERALKNSPEYKIQNYKPYKPMVAKNGGSVKSKTKK